MTSRESGLDDSPEDAASMERLLRYERHLDGDAFTAIVVAQAATQRRQRAWILGGCAALSAACAAVLMPTDILSLLDARLPWRAVSESVASIPVFGIAAGVVLFAVVLGVSQASEEM